MPPIDLRKRRERRSFTTEQVLGLLQHEAPQFFDLAEVVGQWVWVEFKDKQPRDITAQLAEFGFHWNNKRQAWQHPCGQFTASTQRDPRTKYGSRFAADSQPA